ncbi:hypothetical protein HK097_011230, partial [Rhizophlyctis rosea]
MHFYGWKKGLKTGMYYLRTRPAAQAIQFTVDQNALKTDSTNTTTSTPATSSTTVPASVVKAAPTPKKVIKKEDVEREVKERMEVEGEGVE